jgi:predicted  nucleic acid-binding Zn-ribbon protein
MITSLMRDAKADAETELMRQREEITDLEEQLGNALGRALTAESRVKEVATQKDALISDLQKEVESAEARAVAAEVGLKNIKDEAACRLADISWKFMEALSSFEEMLADRNGEE